MRTILAAVLTVLSVASCANGEGHEEAAVEGGIPAEATIGESSPFDEATLDSRSSSMTCWSTNDLSGEAGIYFDDVTEDQGLIEPLLGMHGHAATWGDVDGDDRLDVFVGTFADRESHRYQLRGAPGPSPDVLLRGGESGFEPIDSFPNMYSRTSGGVMVDLDLDGDHELVLSRNWDEDIPAAPPTQILRNDGGSLVSSSDHGLPELFGGRSVGVLDFDGDGRLDLYLVEDRFSGGNSRLMRNTGNLRFDDVTQSAGLPAGVHGLGVAVADLTNDGYQDILVTGSNRLFIASGDGEFTEASSEGLQWQTLGNEDDVAGVSVADVNRDGWLDVVIGQHFNSTVDDGRQVPVRLYLNRGLDGDGMPILEDVTQQAGLVGLPTKAPHVEINDFDNDGWPDILTTASAGGGTVPAVFRHAGLIDDVPTFEPPEGLGSLQYWVAGPTADFDQDGRLDILLVEWEPSLPSLLLRNVSDSSNWLEISVGPENGHGIGWRIEIYEEGKSGDVDALLGSREITVTQGYSAGVAPIAHFGLGDHDSVDLRIEPGAGAKPIVINSVAANQHLRYPVGC